MVAELSLADMAGAAEVYRLTVDEFMRMGEAGILTEDDRIELLDGVMVEMSPISLLHMMVVAYLQGLFDDARRGRYIVHTQNPVQLSQRSAPQPDLYLARLPLSRYRSRLPGPDDVVLLVEVADSSLAYDRTVKQRLYARAGIVEYWIVDLVHGQILAHRNSQGDSYADVSAYSAGDLVSPAFFPELKLSVSEILKPSEA